MPRLRACWVVLALVCVGCASATPSANLLDAGQARIDGGPRPDGGPADGGGLPDGGGPEDGGLVPDGGASPDGGPFLDGGFPDGGLVLDGGPAHDGGAPVDGGPSCPAVHVTPATTSAGIDCDATIDPAAVRAQVCAGIRVAAGLYNEDLTSHTRAWEREGDGSGHDILACRTSLELARNLVSSQHLGVTLTGCETATADYFSFEARAEGAVHPTLLFRVNQCDRWPYIVTSPNSTEGPLGQIGPPGVSLTQELIAHAAQYLWFVEKDLRTSFFLLGARPITGGSGPGSALCEAELAGSTIIVRKVSFTTVAGIRTITRSVEERASFAADCAPWDGG
jgi:hypothetical protein